MDQSETLIVFHWNEPETGFPRALLVCSHAQQRRALGSRMACIMCKDHSTKFHLLTAIDTNNTPTSHVSHRRLEGVFQNSHGVERGQYFSLPSSFLPSSIPHPSPSPSSPLTSALTIRTTRGKKQHNRNNSQGQAALAKQWRWFSNPDVTGCDFDNL